MPEEEQEVHEDWDTLTGETEEDPGIVEDAESAETDYDLGEKAPMSHGVKIRGKVKRGEGTRDQDELVIEGRGESAVEAVIDFEDALKAAEERGWADRLRAMQPGEETDEEETDGE